MGSFKQVPATENKLAAVAGSTRYDITLTTDGVTQFITSDLDVDVQSQWGWSVTFPTTPTGAPATDYEVANKKYVDDEVAVVDGKRALQMMLMGG